ncbi:MAG: hypothetical protein GX640_04205 [Fibrobacter sp.]|nr:hypothetical protein [Fibrobacter sp.]
MNDTFSLHNDVNIRNINAFCSSLFPVNYRKFWPDPICGLLGDILQYSFLRGLQDYDEIIDLLNHTADELIHLFVSIRYDKANTSNHFIDHGIQILSDKEIADHLLYIIRNRLQLVKNVMGTNDKYTIYEVINEIRNQNRDNYEQQPE